MQYKKEFYNKKDSYKMFSSVAMWYLAAVIGLSFIYATIAVIAGVESSVVTKSAFTEYFNYFAPALIFFAVFYFYNKRKKINIVKATKLNVKINTKQTLILILISVVSLVFLSRIVGLFDYFVSTTNYKFMEDLGFKINNIGSLLFALVTFAVLPALTEELIFRGVIFNGIQKTDGHKKAAIISAVFFMLIHMSVQQTVFQLILGIVLAYCVYITGSLWAGILVHFLNNATVVIATYAFTVFNYESTLTSTAVPSTLADYLLPVLYFAVGVAILVGLFKLLKNVSLKQEESLEEESNEIIKKEKVGYLLTVGLVITVTMLLIDISSMF